MNTKNIPLYLLGLLVLAGWGKTFRQLLVKLPPAGRSRYITAGNWQDIGYPHGRSPRIIDGTGVWIWSQYGKDTGSEKGGFIRFSLTEGTAEMRWPFPGKSRYARIHAVTRGRKGRPTVLWSPQGGNMRMDTLLPGGGLGFRGRIPVPEKNRTLIGFTLRGSAPALAFGGRHSRSTTILSKTASGKWTERAIPWPGQYPVPLLPLFAQYKAGHWITWFSEHNRQSGRKPHDNRIFRYTEGTPNARPAGMVTLPSWELPISIDRSPGNMISGLSSITGRIYGLQVTSIRQMLPPEPGLRPDYLHGTFLLTPEGDLERVLYWSSRGSINRLLFSVAGKRYAVEYGRHPDARNIRHAMKIVPEGAAAGEPVAESFRFRGGYPVPAPDGRDGLRLLGTFGYHIHVDREGKRIGAPGIFSRFISVINRFSGPGTAYDDFYLETPVLKIAAVFMVLFLPGLLLAAIFFGNRKRKQIPISVAITGIILTMISYPWYWKIITEL